MSMDHLRAGWWLAFLLMGLGLRGGAVAAETRDAKVDDLTLAVPTTWKQQPPANNLRLGQFEVPAAEGDKEPAELSIFNFGAGGGIGDNVSRWVGQFLAEGRQVVTTEGKCPLGTYVLVDVKGTYKKPVGPPRLGKTEPMPAAQMLGVILSVEKRGLYFLKLTGPEKTVSGSADALRTAIGAKAADEKPFEVK